MSSGTEPERKNTKGGGARYRDIKKKKGKRLAPSFRSFGKKMGGGGIRRNGKNRKSVEKVV